MNTRYYILPFSRIVEQTETTLETKRLCLPKSQCVLTSIGEKKCVLVPHWLYVKNRQLLGYLAENTRKVE